MEKVYDKKMNEILIKEKLNNGLHMYIFNKKGFKKQYAVISVDYGSNDTEFIDVETGEKVSSPKGIAHFLEHQLFEDKESSIFDKFADLGASANAYTSFNSTNYLFSSTENFNESLMNLLDFVQTPYFTEKSVNKEKGIIMQEIKMYQDDPYWRSLFNMLSGLYNNHPVKNDIAGTVESVNSISPEDLYLCHKNFYQPANMDLILIGDIDEKKIIDLVRENQLNKSFSELKTPVKIIPEESKTINKKHIEVEMNISRPLVQIAFKDIENPTTPKEIIKKEYAVNILLDILFARSSLRYNKFYEQGIIDSSFSSTYIRKEDYGYIHLHGESRKADKMITGIADSLKKIEKKEIDEGFSRIKKRYLGGYIKMFNNFGSLASEFINYRRLGIDIFSLMEIIDEIKIEELYNYADSLFDENLMVESIVKNKQD
ncbi:MAG: EF-P 5-aminopentanol modification-associated protein YfmH [Bacillota bacterium]